LIKPLMIRGALREVALTQHETTWLEISESRRFIGGKRGSRRLYYKSKSEVEFLCHECSVC
jgi:hypothetical protein